MKKRYFSYYAVLASLACLTGTVRGDSLNVRSIGSYQFPSIGWNIFAQGNYVYIAADSTGLRICDVSNPAVPVEVGKFRTTGLSEHVFVKDNLAYVACAYPGGLQIIDVSNPHRPSQVSLYPTSNVLLNSFVRDTLAFVAGTRGSFQIINVADPLQPTEIGYCDLGGGSAWWCVVSGDYAYIASDSIGLRIVDISDPVYPHEVGSCSISQIYCVEICGRYIYAACGEDGLNIIDVNDASAPEIIASYATGGFAVGLKVADSIAYIGDTPGIKLIDVRVPLYPYLIGYYVDATYQYGLDVENGYVYAAVESPGLQVYQYYGPNGIETQLQNCSDIVYPKISLKCSPNPFLSQMHMSFNLDKASEVNLEAFNLTGQMIAAKNYGRMEAGRHSLPWRIAAAGNAPLPEGVYLIRLKAGNAIAVTKVIKVK